MKHIPNAYGATIRSVERVAHKDSLVWRKVTWVNSENSRAYTAKTLPGCDANRAVDNLPDGTKVRIILNGRNQIIVVEPFENTLDELLAQQKKA